MLHTLRHLGRCTGTIALLSGALSSLGAQQAGQPDEGRVTKANWALANRFSTSALRAITYTQGVQPRFLEAALDAIEGGHGGIDRYLAQRMRLSDAARERLRALYLEPALAGNE